MISRAAAVEYSAASHRLERLSASEEVKRLLAAWAAGQVSDAELEEAARRVLAGEPLSDRTRVDPPAA